MKPTVWLLAALAVCSFVSLWISSPAHAWPKYAQAEGVPCAYCHVNPAGGGARNYRGLFYKARNLSFAGFNDADEAKRAGVAVGPNADATPNSAKPKAAAAAPSSAPAAGVNLLQTPDKLAAWRPFEPAEGAQATLALDDGAGAPAALRVRITAKGDEAWHVRLSQTLAGLKEGGQYLLRFRAKADAAGRTVQVRPMVMEGDYHDIGLSQTITLSPEWQEFSFPLWPRAFRPRTTPYPTS
jgi:hypothetical protein